jgi:hypothetical protein
MGPDCLRKQKALRCVSSAATGTPAESPSFRAGSMSICACRLHQNFGALLRFRLWKVTVFPSVSLIIAIKQIGVSRRMITGIPRAWTAAAAASISSTANKIPLLGWNGITSPAPPQRPILGIHAGWFESQDITIERYRAGRVPDHITGQVDAGNRERVFAHVRRLPHRSPDPGDHRGALR